MARKKEYIEEEVIEKAMHLFWHNGYEGTSVRMLEKEMGINQFSIYSSFGSKHGVFQESLKCYKQKVSAIFNKLKTATRGVEDIKEFFYDSIRASQELGNQKGCLVTNTYNEFAEKEDDVIRKEIVDFMEGLKAIFIEKLRLDSSKDEVTIRKQANYLLLAKHGLAAASRVNSKEELEDYIEMTFRNI
ncbi:TetR/AcrR family transcriptional regulator [Maribacter sp. ANRC-HE7]|uniref:TetR/AcrR family transcriptional regulator n=1 Tax=Maribacter aquimaris TaxID=2737171 RepID=A0ABR7V5I6_9FLAO|nr:TetR/AcrR family transcriptional regulator [Maribacter aquimaris]MBD0780068.1 TetR/AcrR family transcriptional regulator [Maribacter aquimaris]